MIDCVQKQHYLLLPIWPKITAPSKLYLIMIFTHSYGKDQKSFNFSVLGRSISCINFIQRTNTLAKCYVANSLFLRFNCNFDIEYIAQEETRRKGDDSVVYHTFDLLIFISLYGRLTIIFLHTLRGYMALISVTRYGNPGTLYRKFQRQLWAHVSRPRT